jgi:hypothetical protein
MSTIAVIGAGASGLVCAIEAARRGKRVEVFEKNAKIGRKILATGNGKCNISNQAIRLERYHGESVHHLKEVFKRFDTLTCKDFFRSIGLEMREGEEGRLYPMSHQASSVVDLLVHEARALGVVFHLESEVKNLTCKNGTFQLDVGDACYVFEKCVIAAGSSAMPSLGSCDSAERFAASFGHRIVPSFASLVQLVSHEAHLKEAAGVKVEACVDLWIEQQKCQSAQGDLLFTPYGFSGNAILDISRKASQALIKGEAVHVIADLMPLYTKDALFSLLQQHLVRAKGKSLSLWLEGLVPKKLALALIHREKLTHIKDAGMLTIKELKKLTFALKAFRAEIHGTKGVESAEVCAGGVDVKEVDAKSLMSHKVKNLYFCGEVLDIDGDCGGFNLHFAWASGFCVGRSL